MSRSQRNVLYSDEAEADDSLETVEIVENQVFDASIGSKRNTWTSMTSDGDEASQEPSLSQSRVIDETADSGLLSASTSSGTNSLVMDTLEGLHSSIASAPPANTIEADPMGLEVELMSHQRRALAWLLHREQQSPPGGVLADETGLGKTLTMIALLMKSKELEKNNKKSSTKKKNLGKTLVVCPSPLIAHWESQVKQHVKKDRLTTLSHHGPNRKEEESSLTGADIVITTYGVLVTDKKKEAALFRVYWDRIILDEAHLIWNYKTQTAVAAYELKGKYRWCLTGTPVEMQSDLYSVLKFLRCLPLDNFLSWKRSVHKTVAGNQRLITLMKSIILRRTKAELKEANGKELFAKKERPERKEPEKKEIRSKNFVLTKVNNRRYEMVVRHGVEVVIRSVADLPEERPEQQAFYFT